MLEKRPVFLLYILKKMSFINAKFFHLNFQKKCSESSKFFNRKFLN